MENFRRHRGYLDPTFFTHMHKAHTHGILYNLKSQTDS